MSLLDRYALECSSHSPAQTHRLGTRFGEVLPCGVVIALTGNLGSGKTHLSRGIGDGWGAEQELRSPTFTLVQEHRRSKDRVRLYHVDLYRVEKASDLASLGLDEIIEDEQAVVLVEWADRAPNLFPANTIHIKIHIISDTKRQMLFSAPNEQMWQILLLFRKNVFGV